VKILLANCIAHGRRQFVDVAASFPQECGYVLESLGMVYGNDAMAATKVSMQRRGCGSISSTADRSWINCMAGSTSNWTTPR
jgi:hypothetical protein